MSLASRLPYDHKYAGGFPGLGSQPVPTDSDCLTYLANVAAADGAAVEVGVATAVDTFFRDTKAAGVFDALKACCILCGARTLTGALVPLAGTAPTSNGFVGGDYSRTDGITGDGTSYLDSGRANDADPQNDQHMSVYVQSADTGGTGAYIGNGDSSGSTVIGANPSGSQLFCRSQSVNADIVGDGDETGFMGLTRSAAASYTFRSLAVDQALANASSSPSTFASLVFARDQDGTAISVTDATLAFYSIGTDIGTSGLAALDTAVSNLITAIGNAL